MKKRRVIWLLVLLAAIILLGSVAFKYRNSIAALIDSFRYSQEEVVRKASENKEQLQKYIDESSGITVRDLTEEESKALSEGKITEEEAIKILTGQASKENPSQNNDEKTPSQTKPATKPESKPTNTVVSEAIAKLYIQKSIYLGKLDGIEARVRQEFIALVKNKSLGKEGQKAAKQQFLKSNISTVAAWETECDSVVYGILDDIKKALKENNEDQSIVKKLEEAYLNEKRLKKSYFINRYMD